MPRPTFVGGEIWDPSLANAAGFPQLTGEDEYGHGPKVIDEWLDDANDQIKARFYDWRDRLKVTVTTGLSVGWDSTAVITTTGTTVSISAGTLSLPDNTSGFIFVDSAGVVTQSTTYPQVGIILAAFTTLSGSITLLSDLRYQSIGIIAPLAVPTNSTFAIGDLKVSARINPPDGWLACNGASYNNAAFPQLVAAIGATYNLPGDAAGTFRVPNLVGRTIVAAGAGTGLTERAVGELIGSENTTLNTSNLPPHNHGVTQTPHNHEVSDSGHTHPVSDPGHAHAFSPTPHSHAINDPGHQHPFWVGDQDRTAGQLGDVDAADASFLKVQTSIPVRPATTGIGVFNASANGTIGNSGTSVSVSSRTTGVTISGSSVSVATTNTGNGAPVSVMQPSLVMNYFIRAS